MADPAPPLPRPQPGHGPVGTGQDRFAGGPARFDAAFYLPGDSYPKDAVVEEWVRKLVGPAFSRWAGPADSPRAAGFETRIPHRIAALEERLPEGEALRRTVLFGRSSGARVITELALRRTVLAVVCLGYPLRRPGQPPDPRRFAHLARLTVPTLILQGSADEYGGPDDIAACPLSPAVTLRVVPGSHAMRLAPAVWRETGRGILAFCDAAAAAHGGTGEATTR